MSYEDKLKELKEQLTQKYRRIPLTIRGVVILITAVYLYARLLEFVDWWKEMPAGQAHEFVILLTLALTILVFFTAVLYWVGASEGWWS